jgi:glycosyltransferase involved in cell wall biosynthesis
VADRVTWYGYVANRAAYLDALGLADVFVFPSGAEGFPKVILDAMAVGVPVLARLSSDPLRSLAAAGLIRPVSGTAEGIEAAIVDLARNPDQAAVLRASGLTFAWRHTRAAEARRLIATLRYRFPDLPWGSPPGEIAPE